MRDTHIETAAVMAAAARLASDSSAGAAPLPDLLRRIRAAHTDRIWGTDVAGRSFEDGYYGDGGPEAVEDLLHASDQYFRNSETFGNNVGIGAVHLELEDADHQSRIADHLDELGDDVSDLELFALGIDPDTA
jgi:hypothetical protein